jgi:hypothetical protein
MVHAKSDKMKHKERKTFILKHLCKAWNMTLDTASLF